MNAVVRDIDAEASRPIRHAVLRPGRPIDDVLFAGDDAPDTVHLGAFVDRELVAVARLSREDPPWGCDPGAWRLRGMATLPEHRNRGIGGALLARCVDRARERGATSVWCNARVVARRFYERAGFRAVGEPFDVPGIGPHLVMTRDPRSG